MSIEEEIVEAILSIHDEEFRNEKYSRLPRWSYKFGEYWVNYFCATRDCLTNSKWSFQINDESIISKKLEEKFERIYQKWCDYHDNKNQLVRENKLKNILSCLKRP